MIDYGMRFVTIFFLLTTSLFSAAVRGSEKEQFVCFSLAAARKEILRGGPVSNMVKCLGMITDPVALVVDPESRDCIIVGRRDEKRPAMYLDDFVVALRAVYIYPHEHGPGVSIEPVQSMDRAEKRYVRYIGGIENTRFGRACFEADYLLKKMDFGLVPTGSPYVVSTWETWSEERTSKGKSSFPQSVNFIYSVGSGALFMENTVSISAFRIAVGSISLEPGGKVSIDAGKSRFTKSLNEHFADVAEAHPVLLDLENLMSLYMMCSAIDSLDIVPHLGFYLKDYEPDFVKTPRAIDALQRKVTGFTYSIEAKGDVKITRGDVIRMKRGDTWAIGHVVLAKRPSPEDLFWIIEIEHAEVEEKSGFDTPARLDLGDFYLRSKQYDKAIEAYAQVVAEGGDFVGGTSGTALAYAGLTDLESALQYAEKAVSADSTSAYAWRVYGEVLVHRGDLENGTSALLRAAAIAPNDDDTGCSLGESYAAANRHAEALAAFNSVLVTNKRCIRALVGKAGSLYETGKYQQSYAQWIRIIRLKPDPESQRIARAGILKLIEENKVVGSSDIVNNFPKRKEPGSRSMWSVSLHLQLDYDFGRDFFAPQATALVDNQQIRITAPLQLAIVIRNRLRLAVNAPFVTQIVPFEKATCFEFPDGTTYCTQSETTLGANGGMTGPSFFISRMWSDGLFGKPLLISHVGVISPTKEPFFERYWNASGGEDAWKGAVPFAHDDWRAKIALSSEIPASPSFNIIFKFFIETNITGTSYDITGIGTGGKKQFMIGKSPVTSGLLLSGFVSDYQQNVRAALTLDMFQGDECQAFAFGAGFRDQKNGSSDNYFFISTGVGFKIFKFMGWF